MEYIAKLRLSKRQYLAVLDKALVIVTENDNGEAVRWLIFEGEAKPDELKKSIQDFLKNTAQ